MDNIFEILGKIVAAVGGAGVIIIAVSTILSKFGIERLTNYLSKKDNRSEEYRLKKDKALEELLNEFNIFYNSNTSKVETILVPRYHCPARKYSKYFLPNIYIFLEDVEKLKEYKIRVIEIITKNQFWFNDKLNLMFNYYVSYLSNVEYIYSHKWIKPSKLYSLFISLDLYIIQANISREVRNCYFLKYKSKYHSIRISKYWKNINNAFKNFTLSNINMMLANEEQRKEFKNIKYTKSNFYKHYQLYRTCELDCPLAKPAPINVVNMEK